MVEERSSAAQPPVDEARLRRLQVLRSAMLYGLFGLLAAELVVQAVGYIIDHGRSGTDFWMMWKSGRAVLHGVSPYPALDSLPGPHETFPRAYTPFLYPAPSAFAIVPFALLPFLVASLLFLALNVAAIVLALRLFGVVDPRCYLVAFLSPTVFQACALGTLGPLLLLAVAAAWRYRNRAVVLGAVVAPAVLAKLFLWPLFVWLARTRRFRAAAFALVLGSAAALTGWALIGWSSLREYPHLLNRLTDYFGPKGYSLFAVGRTIGLPTGPAQLVQLGVALAVLLIAVLYFRRRPAEADQGLFTVVLFAALLATPILWPHYFILLLAPIALARPRFSPLWLLPLLLWSDTATWSGGRIEWILPVQLLSALIFGWSLRAQAARRAEGANVTTAGEPAFGVSRRTGRAAEIAPQA